MVTAFKNCEGVLAVDVDCSKGIAKVTFDPKKTTVETLMKDALKGTKFSASKIEEKKT